VGFAYYNLAIHEAYACNRQNFISQALSCLLKSLEINANNYLAQYCVAKIYLMEFDYDLAYKHSMESCKSGRGEWVPFSLLACVYFCQKRVSKASLIVEELIKKYSFNKVLHYVRAYL
jgi:tetratricopeptide (TPR) repeat protein